MNRGRKTVFVGKDTKDGEYFVLYVEAVTPMEELLYYSSKQNRLPPRDEYFIKFPDGEVWALPSGSKITTWEDDPDNHLVHLRIESSVWTGEAIGTREDLIREEGYSV